MPPHSSFTPISLEERKALMQQSIVAGIYEQPVDRDSAHEMLQKRSQNASNRLRPPNLPNSKARNRKLLPSSKLKNRNVWHENSKKKLNAQPSNEKN